LPLAGRIFGLFTPHLNRYVARIAGGRFVPMWSLLRHRGRRSGRAYATPVTARRVRDGFAIALAFGPRADWARNVVNGEASIRWRGREYPLSRGEVLDVSAENVALSPSQQALLRKVGVGQFLYLRDRDAPAR
jgi:deazaflavin-dependent oxidoreductase (nitroreductase family)